MQSGFPVKRLLFAGGVFLYALLYTNEKGAESSKILNLFIHAPLREMMIVDISLDCGVSETTMGHSRQASVTTFPHVSLLTKVMIVLRRSLYDVVSDGRVLAF